METIINCSPTSSHTTRWFVLLLFWSRARHLVAHHIATQRETTTSVVPAASFAYEPQTSTICPMAQTGSLWRPCCRRGNRGSEGAPTRHVVYRCCKTGSVLGGRTSRVRTILSVFPTTTIALFPASPSPLVARRLVCWTPSSFVIKRGGANSHS